ncbi:MAG TPA: arylsulfotransferase family protein, partial [Solirubrobacteraceae bacterium]
TRTAWQHDAREQADGTITFFDNEATPAVRSQSRAIQLRLDLQQKTATLVREATHPRRPLVAGSQGNTQQLDNGDWMVGWGEAPYFSEFSPGGALLFDAHLPATYESYRAYRLPWAGQPVDTPALAVVPARAGTGHRAGRAAATIYASWNGATNLASWRVLTGASPSTLTEVASAAKSGFETALSVPNLPTGDYVQVQALDGTGVVIGASHVKRV